MKTFAALLAVVAVPGLAFANELDVSVGLDAGATSASDDQIGYGNFRVGYVLRPHLTLALTGRAGNGTQGDRFLGAIGGGVELWQQFGKLRGSVKFGGIHQHEAPNESLVDRPGSVIGGVDDDIAHRTAGVSGLSAVADFYETKSGSLYGGAELTTMLWADGAGPRWTFLAGLVAGFRVELKRSGG